MEIRKSGSEKCYTRTLSSGINKIWINIVVVSIIFALVRATAATTETLAPPPQKRGSSMFKQIVANVCFDELIEGIFWKLFFYIEYF